MSTRHRGKSHATATRQALRQHNNGNGAGGHNPLPIDGYDPITHDRRTGPDKKITRIWMDQITSLTKDFG